ncbi:MAG: AsmA family protein [Cyclobacteriaceae bacterium]|nr:AsmA family protein [Cyclobacteriaceae bacterium]
MIIRKTLKKILLGIIISILAILLFGIGFVILKKDEIIQYAITEANNYIATPVSVNKIDISFLRHFPSISVEMEGVSVKSGSGVNDVQIARAKRVSFSLNTFQLINKNYVINGLHIENADLELSVDALGNPNYLILKPTGEAKGGFFEINNITAENTTVLYRDLKSDYSLKLLVKNAKASLIQEGKQLSIKVSAGLITDEIRVDDRVFFNNKNVDIDSDIDYKTDSKIYTFSDTRLKIDNGEFKVTGQVDQVAKTLDLDIIGVNTSFKSINSLLSNDLATYFKDYDSKGDVFFSGNVEGRFDSPNRPMVTLDFGAKKASFFHPGYKKAIDNVNLTGHFTTGKINTFKNYRLEIKDFSCELDKRLLSGSLTIRDFDNYYIDLQLKGEADVNTLLLLMPEKYVQTAFGNVRLDIHLTGPIKDPKFSKNFLADGDVELQNLSIVLTGERLPINKVNGILSFRKNDLAVSNLHGLVGQNDFILNGFVRELGGLFVSANSPIIIEADLKSNHLNFDELLRSNFAFRDTTLGNSKKYEFGISPRVSLKFNCDINHLNFKRFHGRNIRGQLSVHQRVALLRNISFKSMGGSVDIGGYVNNKKSSVSRSHC